MPNLKSFGQSCDSTFLTRAYTLQSEGDYYYAAKLFLAVASNCSDSSEIAEALYGFVTCGDKAAQVFTMRINIAEDLRYSSGWHMPQEGFDSVIQRDINLYNGIGLHLRIENVFETHCLNLDTTIRRTLSTTFARTVFGELAQFDLITVPYDSTGSDLTFGPHSVIQASLRFLQVYPNSPYSYDVALILGKAFQDLWNFSKIDVYRDMLTKSEIEDPSQLRDHAISNFVTAEKNRDKLKKSRWNETYD